LFGHFVLTPDEVNHYIDTMTMWQPEITNLPGPRYIAIAEVLAADVRSGQLAPGDRLPTHRDLAFRLGVTVGTVSRAYAEAERRGLIGGEVGRGTFVRPDARRRKANVTTADQDAPLGLPQVIDLSVNIPTPMTSDSIIAETMADIARRPGIARLMDYHPHAGVAAHREAGAQWLTECGFPIDAGRVIVTAGGQHAMTAALGALTEPGDIVLAESLTYPGLRRLADFLRVRVHGVAMDEDGVDPAAFETACRSLNPKVFYCVTNLQNPTALVMPAERRRELGAIAQRHGVKIVEDDVYGFLLGEDTPPALASFAPELGHYFTSLSKSMAPGLRVGYLALPAGSKDDFTQVVRSTTWMATPLTAQIGTEWIQNGIGRELADSHRDEAIERQKIARRILDGHDLSPEMRAYHLWLRLPEPWSAEAFALELRMRGVAVTPSSAFATTRNAPAAVRLCLCEPPERDTLQRGLEIIASTARSAPGVGINADMGVV
jgi:DNA-binding transcriptional MocR family regulator